MQVGREEGGACAAGGCKLSISPGLRAPHSKSVSLAARSWAGLMAGRQCKLGAMMGRGSVGLGVSVMPPPPPPASVHPRRMPGPLAAAAPNDAG